MLKRTPSLTSPPHAKDSDNDHQVLVTCYPPDELFEPPNDPRPVDQDPVGPSPDKPITDEDRIQLLTNRIAFLEYRLSAVINLLSKPPEHLVDLSRLA